MRGLFLVSTLTFVSISSSAFAVLGPPGSLVHDPAVFEFLKNDVDKHIREQTEIISSNRDILDEMSDSLTGNSADSYTILSNQSFGHDILSVRIPYLMKEKKLKSIERELNKNYPEQRLEFSKESMKKGRQQRQRQSELKQAIIYSTDIINNSKTRSSEVESLVREVDQKTTLKQALDLNNKIAIENMIETSKNNLLLALLLRVKAQEFYKGPINLAVASDIIEKQREGQRARGFQKTYPNSMFNQMFNK